MENLLQQIAGYKEEISALEFNGAVALEEYRIKFLGTKGIVKALFGEMKNIPSERKKEFGAVLNDFKVLLKKNLKPGKAASLNLHWQMKQTANQQALILACLEIHFH